MTPIASSGRYSLLAVVGAGFVVAAPLATWLAVGAVTAPSNERAPLTLDVPSCHSGAMFDVVEHVDIPTVATAEPARVDDLHALAQDARVVPKFENGRVVGMKLFSIKPDSLYAQVGLQNGDIVTRVNGIALTPDHAMKAYETVRESRVVVVDFLRRGERGTLTHSLPASE